MTQLGKEYYVHPTACVDEPVQIGKQSKIWHFCHVMSDSIIGDQCILGQNVFIAPKVTIGHRCKIQNNVSLYTGVQLEDDVFIGPSAVFTNVLQPRAFIEQKHNFAPTLIRKGATIGANATIVCGTTIGQYAMIGAGSVITKDVPDYALVYGSPSVWQAWVCQCGQKLQSNTEEYHCTSCHRQYQEIDGILKPTI